MKTFDIIQRADGIQYALDENRKAVYYRPYRLANWFVTSVTPYLAEFDCKGAEAIDETEIDRECPVYDGFNAQAISDYLRTKVDAAPATGKAALVINNVTVARPDVFYKYAEWVVRRTAEGVEMKMYKAPCCASVLFATVPRDGEKVYNSLVSCPICDKIFMRSIFPGKWPGKTTVVTNIAVKDSVNDF